MSLDCTSVPQIRSVSPEEAAELVKKDGYVILDVRPEGDFKEVTSCSTVERATFEALFST